MTYVKLFFQHNYVFFLKKKNSMYDICLIYIYIYEFKLFYNPKKNLNYFNIFNLTP